MNYVEAGSIGEALGLLAGTPDARPIAGGATLVAMLNAGLIAPPLLVGLRRVTELHGITPAPGGLRIGAMTRHADIAADKRLTGAWRVIASAAQQIAHPAIRNVGTIGGAICHADPAADFPAALVAADAAVEMAGLGGERTLKIEDFFRDYLETALEPGELLTAVTLPDGPRAAGGYHLKFARVDGDYATVSLAAVVALEDGVCSYARIAVGSCGPRPVRVVEAERNLIGSALEPGAVKAAGELLADAADPVDDVRGSAQYRRMLIPRLLGRALVRARENADA